MSISENQGISGKDIGASEDQEIGLEIIVNIANYPDVLIC